LIIDDIVLYDAAPAGEPQPFPRRVLFTAWFNTGKQGVEWPGDFEIVNNEPPLTWKEARSVGNPQTGQPWIRVQRAESVWPAAHAMVLIMQRYFKRKPGSAFRGCRGAHLSSLKNRERFLYKARP
jgi:hypothetical protein